MEIVVVAIAGLLVGTFLDVCIERLPAGASLLSLRRRCPVCGRVGSALERVPAVGAAVVGGRCPGCRSAVPLRSAVVELCTAALFALVWLRFGYTWETVVAVAYASLFVVILFIDLEHRLILNRLVYPAAVVALAISPLWPELSLRGAVIGGAIGFVVMLVPCVLGGMGGGDVQLAGLIGIMVGFPLVFVALVISMISGGVFAALLLVTGRKGRKDAIAYGPFLAVAGIATLLYGQTIWNWYIGRFIS